MLIERRRSKTNIEIDQKDDEGRTPFHLAVMANRYDFVSYLLKNGAHLEVRDIFFIVNPLMFLSFLFI